MHNFFRYPTMILVPPAIGNKGAVGLKTQRFFFQPLTNCRIYDGSSGVKEVAKACVRYTHVSNRILEGVESLVNKILNVKTDNQYIKDDSNKDDIMAISESRSDIR